MIYVHSNGTNSIVTSQLTYRVFVRARWHSIDRVVTTHNSVCVRKHALTECEHVGLSEVELVNLSVETEPNYYQQHGPAVPRTGGRSYVTGSIHE